MKQIKKNYVTEDGYKDITDELDTRKTKTRKEIAERIKYAKEFGDLSENAAYTEAREAQNENESRIKELEDLVLITEIVKKDKNSNTIQIGSSFTVELNGKDFNYSIVGPQEADPSLFKISHESPLGKTFLDKKKGSTVEFTSPSGTKMIFKIKDIK